MIERGLTQEDLAIACGLKKLAIQRILSSEVKKPHKDTIKAICNYLRISPMEIIEEKTEISKKKLLEIMLTRFGIYSDFDYFIFGKVNSLEVKDVKSLVNDYGINISYIALGSGEINKVEFDESKLLIYLLDNDLDYEAVYINKDRALRKTDSFVTYSKSFLKCKPLDACTLLKTSESGRLFVDFKAIKILSRYKRIGFDFLEERLKQVIDDLPNNYLHQLKHKPLEGALDAKVLGVLTDMLEVKAKDLLYPEWLQ